MLFLIRFNKWLISTDMDSFNQLLTLFRKYHNIEIAYK
jgi:hypothetical protein